MADYVPDRTIPEIVTSFVGKLCTLMADAARRSPGDAVIARAQKRLRAAADMLPVDIISVAGPFLFAHRDTIMSDDPAVIERFFAPGAFDADLAKAEDQSKKDIAVYMIPKIQETARQLSADDRQGYIETLQCLLDDYMDWQILMEPQQ